MSGKPNPEGITKIINLLDHRAKLVNEATALRQAVARLKDVEDSINATTRNIWTQMEAMDLTSSGNYGHEGRMLSFLVELRRQLDTLNAFLGTMIVTPKGRDTEDVAKTGSTSVETP